MVSNAELNTDARNGRLRVASRVENDEKNADQNRDDQDCNAQFSHSVLCGLTSRAQARGADDVVRESGTGDAIPRCLQRFVRPLSQTCAVFELHQKPCCHYNRGVHVSCSVDMLCWCRQLASQAK